MTVGLATHSELIILGGDSRAAVLARAAELRERMARDPSAEVGELAVLVHDEGQAGQRNLAIVASSAADLDRKLAYASQRLNDPSVERVRERSGVYFSDAPLAKQGRMAFLFPGEGAQYANMLLDLCTSFAPVRGWFDLMDRAFARHRRNYLPSQVIFPTPGTPPEVVEQRLWQMDCGTEAVFAANQALWALLSRLDVRPDVVVGHSTGEYSALSAAGAFGVTNGDQLIQHIAELNDVYEELRSEGQIPAGALVAVASAERDRVVALAEHRGERLSIAMDNCPNQIVLCGDEPDIDAAIATLRLSGAICSRLPFDRAYHTPRFAPFCERLRGFYDGLSFVSARIPIYSCATASPFPADPADMRVLARAQWAQPVKFRQTVEAMYADGVRLFVEVGPKGNLTAFVEDTLRGRPHLAVPANVKHRAGITQLHHMLGMLAVEGVPMQLDYLYVSRRPRRAKPTATRLATSLPILKLPDRTRTRPTPAVTPDPGLAITPTRSTREQVMQAYLSTMEHFLALQEQVVNGAASRRTEPAKQRSFPLLSSVVQMEPGRQLVARRDFALTQDLFLEDHTLGGYVSSADESLLALPLLPLTMSMEMLAEAAAALFPGKVVTGMRDVRAERWVAFDRGPVSLEVAAETTRDAPADFGGVEVQVQISDASDSARGPVVQGTVIVSDACPDAPPAEKFSLRNERPSRWTNETLYREGMFHGPRFRCVVSVERWAEDGTEATLESLPSDTLFVSEPHPQFIIDPVLLDGLGQLVGFWTTEHLDRAFHVFPFHVEEFELFDPAPLPVGWRAVGRARIQLVGDLETRANLELVSPNGSVRARLNGWRDRRFDVPAAFHRLRVAPRQATLSTCWPAAVGDLNKIDQFVCSRVDNLSHEFLDNHDGLWRRVLAQLVLSRRERTQWQAMTGRAHRLNQWLLGRVAVKDAVRMFVQRRCGVELFPADIEISEDEQGAPSVSGYWTRELARPPLVSLSHSGEVAVALAGDDARSNGIGIDLELIGKLPEEVSSIAFAPQEQALVPATSEAERDEWLLRLWCAKESLGKALGTGLLGGPLSALVTRLDRDSGAVQMTVAGALAARLPEFVDEPLIALSTRLGDLVVATCFIASSAMLGTTRLQSTGEDRKAGR